VDAIVAIAAVTEQLSHAVDASGTILTAVYSLAAVAAVIRQPCASLIVQEKLLNPHFEELGETEGKRKARVKLPCFDSVDRLPGHLGTLSEGRLRPTTFGAKVRNAVLHRYRI
jgi:hypothetical protein